MTPELSRSYAGGDRDLSFEAAVESAETLLLDGRLREARRWLDANDARVIREQRELTEIPAPPFGEAERATRFVELLEQSGLGGIRIDEEGNVLAPLRGSLDDAATWDAYIVSAHLDTVFPEGTDVRVREDGDRLIAPGISDDGRGLAALLALVRAFVELDLPARVPVVFVATVGEEGVGDLRGVRYLFREGSPAMGARGFISLDGAGLSRIVSAGLGSRRFRIGARGPGGHSWVNWGTVNPIHALGKAVARFAAIPLPEQPLATLTVARWGGGTSVNAIPQEAWVEVDVRCASERVLDEIEAQVRTAVTVSVAEVNAAADAGTDPLELTVESLGARPAGETHARAAIVRAALAATQAIGPYPELAVSSTDANIPMSLGIPAITLGAGGEAGAAHTPDEWYRNVQGPEGILRVLLLLLLLES
jgi:tripeptide aminopeptidase